MSRNIDRTRNTIKPKFDFTVDPPAIDTSYLPHHANATRVKYNALNAQKFNELEQLLYDLSDLVGDADTDFNDIENTSPNLLTITDKIRDIVNYVKAKLSTTFIATHARLVLGEGVVKRFLNELIITQPSGSCGVNEFMIENGFAITPEAVSYNIVGTKIEFNTASTFETPGTDHIAFAESWPGNVPNKGYPPSPPYTSEELATLEACKREIKSISTPSGTRYYAFVGNKYLVKDGMQKLDEDEEPIPGANVTLAAVPAYNWPDNLALGQEVTNNYDDGNWWETDELVIDTYNGILYNIPVTWKFSQPTAYIYVWYQAWTYRVDGVCVGSTGSGVPYKAPGNTFLPPVSSYTEYVNNTTHKVTMTDTWLSDVTKYIYPDSAFVPNIDTADSLIHYFIGRPIQNTESPELWYPISYTNNLQISDFLDNRKFIEPYNLVTDLYNHIRSATLGEADNHGADDNGKLAAFVTAEITSVTVPEDEGSHDRVYTFYYYMNNSMVSSPVAYEITGDGIPGDYDNYKCKMPIVLVISGTGGNLDAGSTFSMVVSEVLGDHIFYLPEIGTDDAVTLYLASDGSTYYDYNFSQLAYANPSSLINQDLLNGVGVKSGHVQKQAIEGTTDDWNGDTNDNTIANSDNVGHIKLRTIGSSELVSNLLNQRHFPDAETVEPGGKGLPIQSLIDAKFLSDNSIDIRMLNKIEEGKKIDFSAIKLAGVQTQNLNTNIAASGLIHGGNIYTSADSTYNTIQKQIEFIHEEINAKRCMFLTPLPYNCTYSVGGTFNLPASPALQVIGTLNYSYWSYSGSGQPFANKYITINSNSSYSIPTGATRILYIRPDAYNTTSTNLLSEAISTYVAQAHDIVVGTMGALGNGVYALIFINGTILMNDGTGPYTMYYA